MLIKSEFGRAELRRGNRNLGQRERAILLMADGKRTDAELFAMFDGSGREIVAELVSTGYLEPDLEPRETNRGAPMSPASTAPLPVAPAEGASSLNAVDQFGGTRSLASARMFLFDLAERLFAPRDKSLAAHYRDELREARDLPSMMAVSRAMLGEIERTAGEIAPTAFRNGWPNCFPSMQCTSSISPC